FRHPRNKQGKKWLGYQDLNLRMAGSKPAALPLGYTPTLGASRREWRLAGVPGFEPGNGGIKTRCLTAWLYPNLCIPPDSLSWCGRRDLNSHAVRHWNL